MSKTVQNKSEIRLTLEAIEIAVLHSWLRDCDKTTEFKVLINYLEEILKVGLEEFFNKEVSDIEYFCKKFAKDTISNILKQSNVYGKNGDEYAMEILFLYYKLLIKYVNKSTDISSNDTFQQFYSSLTQNLIEIFDFQKPFYKDLSHSRFNDNKRCLGVENFNTFLNFKEKTVEIFSVGDYVDVKIEFGNISHYFGVKHIWTRGVLQNITSDFYDVYTFESGNVKLKKDSMDIALKGTMAVDYEWRVSLEEMSVIDGYDRQKWYPSTILVSLFLF